jgi:hypothetical protein
MTKLVVIPAQAGIQEQNITVITRSSNLKVIYDRVMTVKENS